MNVQELFDNSNEGGGIKVNMVHKIILSDGYIALIVIFLILYILSTIAKFRRA